MGSEPLLVNAVRSVRSLAPTLATLEHAPQERADIQAAVERGYFKPDEEGRLRAWFARYLTLRAALRETVEDIRPLATGETDPGPDVRLRSFVIAYLSACALVRTARFLVGELATHKVVQRKLNEGSERHRVRRKQYTAVRRSLTSPRNAWRLYEARQYADAHAADIDALRDDPMMGDLVAWLRDVEAALDVSVRAFAKARLRYRWHAWRRRRASVWQQVLFGTAEVTGRMIAEVRNPLHQDRVTAELRAELLALMEPGDVLAMRHDRALSNLFLPGYWPHVGLYIGPPAVWKELAEALDEDRAERWTGESMFLEARKDGVLFRALDDTLAVDSVAVIRPKLDQVQIVQSIANAMTHEGKLYNFDFDFFTDDRLVCTELVYRAFEGMGAIEFRLAERAGRVTLSAEDVLDMALEARGFDVVAVAGTPSVGDRVVTGSDAVDALRASFRASDTD